MAQTTSGEMFVPEVYADMAQGQFTGALRVGNSSAVIQDSTLEGAPGDTVTFPKWGALGELDDLTEGTDLTTTKMSTSDSTATIKEAGKAVEITDKARLVALGDPLAEARRQFGVLAARKTDSELISQAQADETSSGGGKPYEVTVEGSDASTKAKLSWAAVVQGIAKFGDEFEPGDFAGLFINSAQLAQAFADDQFIDASKFGAATPVQTGSLGRIGGIDVFVTDRVAADKVLLMKRNSLGLLYKQRPVVEQDRDILARSTVLTTTMHYAVKRLSDKGVCVVTLAVGS